MSCKVKKPSVSEPVAQQGQKREWGGQKANWDKRGASWTSQGNRWSGSSSGWSSNSWSKQQKTADVAKGK